MSRELWCAFGLWLLVVGPRALAGNPRIDGNDWDQLQQLRPGEPIQVERRERSP